MNTTHDEMVSNIGHHAQLKSTKAVVYIRDVEDGMYLINYGNGNVWITPDSVDVWTHDQYAEWRRG